MVFGLGGESSFSRKWGWLGTGGELGRQRIGVADAAEWAAVSRGQEKAAAASHPAVSEAPAVEADKEGHSARDALFEVGAADGFEGGADACAILLGEGNLAEFGFGYGEDHADHRRAL